MTWIAQKVGGFQTGEWLWLVDSGEPDGPGLGGTVTLGKPCDLPEPQLLHPGNPRVGNALPGDIQGRGKDGAPDLCASRGSLTSALRTRAPSPPLKQTTN